VGASFLARQGRLVAYSVFQQRRRGERVFYAAPRVLGYLEAFIHATGYDGVGHLDLRYDPQTDRYAILELNPRFWASLLYARRAGINYPDLLLRSATLAPAGVLTARPGPVRLPGYEIAMTLATRWAAQTYEQASGARL
jgi:predicted ATP-grasp superfamily ATP-dependent carboligase